MKIKSKFLFPILFLAFISCDKNRVFDEYKSVDNAWHKDSVVTFTLPDIDVQKKYNLYLNLRDNKAYPFNNIFLIVSMEQPDKKVAVDTLEYQMANPDGSLMGEGFTDVKTSKLVYKENFTFPKKGKYVIKIQHATRQTGKIGGVVKLDGITDVGLRIESK